MPKKVPEVVQCNSVDTLERELKQISDGLSLEETEETWDKISLSVFYLTALSKGGACDFPKVLLPALKTLSRPLNSALNSERSRLSGAVTDLLDTLSTALGPEFEPMIPFFVPTLLGLATRTNKLFTTRAKSSILSIIENTQLPSMLNYLKIAVNDKSASLRLVATDAVYSCLNCFNPPDLVVGTRAEDIETIIRSTARDANADVRKSSRKVFEAYKILLPHRVDAFVGPLTPTMKKYLDIKGHFPKSASSSSLAAHMASSMPATSSASMGTSQPSHKNHTRSASTHTAHRNDIGGPQVKHMTSRPQLVAVESDSALVNIARKEKLKNDMGPPMFIPNHARTQTVSTSWAPTDSSAKPPNRHTPIEPTKPNRPINTAEHENPSRPMSAFSMSSHSHARMQNVSGVVGGAQRPPIHNGIAQPVSTPNLTKGPVRPGHVHTNHVKGEPEKPMVPDGARRAARPPIVQPTASSSKMMKQDAVLEVGGRSDILRPVQSEADPPKAVKEKSLKEDRGRSESRADNSNKEDKKARSKTVESARRVEKKSKDPLFVSVDKEPRQKDETMSKPKTAGNDLRTKEGKGTRTKTQLLDPKPKTEETTSMNETQKRPPRSLTAPTLSQLAKIKTVTKSVADAKNQQPKDGVRPLKVNKKVPLKNAKVQLKLEDSKKSREVERSLESASQTIADEPTDVPQERSELSEPPENIPLPESPKQTSPLVLEEQEGPAIIPELVFTHSYESPSTDRNEPSNHTAIAATPISSLVLSIQKGFMFTPYGDGDTTLPFPEDNSLTEQQSDNELEGLEFKMDGIDTAGNIIESPRKKPSQLKEFNNANEVRNVFAPINA